VKPYYRREPTRLEEIAERVRVGKKVSAEDMQFYQERRRHGRVDVTAANQGGESGKGAPLDDRRNHHSGAADSEHHTQLQADCTEYAGVRRGGCAEGSGEEGKVNWLKDLALDHWHGFMQELADIREEFMATFRRDDVL